jgi:hypothetical protein
MSTQDELHKFYGQRYDTRDTSMDQYELSGYNLAEGFDPGDRIIHINCGSNPFKGMIPNFRAQDPSNTQADVVVSLEEYTNSYKTDKFNVALVLHGLDTITSAAEMERQVKLISTVMVKRDARIFWRTAIDNVYPWTFDEHTRLAESINYYIVAMAMETDNDIYAEWGSVNRSISYQLS